MAFKSWMNASLLQPPVCCNHGLLPRVGRRVLPTEDSCCAIHLQTNIPPSTLIFQSDGLVTPT